MEVETTITLYKVFGWLRANRKRVVAGGVAAALIAAVVSFYIIHKNQNEADADQELLAQPLGLSTTDPANPETLLKISRAYPGTAAGADAQLLAAKALFLESKYKEAQEAFSKFISDNPGNPLVPRAQVGVAASLESADKISDAVQKYKEVAAIYSSQPDITYPVKLTLGRLSEAQGKPDAAVTYYTELARLNNPYDPWVAEAKERLRLLLAKHPELDKSSGVNPYQTPSLMSPAAAEVASPLTPSAADIQLSAPPATQSAAPGTAPATTPKTNQEAPAAPAPGSPPAGNNPGGNPR